MSTFLHFNRRRIDAPLAECEAVMLRLAGGGFDLPEFTGVGQI